MYALFESAKYMRPNPFDMSLVNSRRQMFKTEKKIIKWRINFAAQLKLWSKNSTMVLT